MVSDEMVKDNDWYYTKRFSEGKGIVKKLILILLLFISINSYSAGPPCPPLSPCWCQQNPTHPKCTQVGVPIDGGIGWLALARVLLGIYFYKKKLL